MKPRIAILACVVAVAIGVTVIVTRSSDEPSGPTATPPSTSTPTTPSPPTAGGSGFGDPSTDTLGRKLTKPNNPAGQPLPQTDPAPGRTECAPTVSTPVTSPEGVMIQSSLAMPLLMSTSDGPARLDDLVPAGYRRSPQGAALAAWNFVSRVYVGSPIFEQAVAKLATGPGKSKVGAVPTESREERAEADQYRSLIAAPEAFRVLTACSDQLVAVELAVHVSGDQTGPGPWWVGLRQNLVWRDGDWRVQIVEDRASLGNGQKHTSLEGWTRWTF